MKNFKKILIVALMGITTLCFSGCTVSDVEEFFGNVTMNSNTSTSIDLDENETLTKLMDTRQIIRNSNVYVETNCYDKIGSIVQKEAKQLGSGVIFAKDSDSYYAITNYHVITTTIEGHIYTYSNYKLTTIDGKEYTADVVYGNPNIDMAIVKFDNTSLYDLADLDTRKNQDISDDEFLLAVGNPNGVKNVVTYGKYLGMAEVRNVDYDVIHHNVLINPGNSGGALCDINGNVVGLNTWGSEDEDDDNYAIPLSNIRAFLTSARVTNIIPSENTL